MPVSGLIVSFKSDPQLRAEAIAAIRAEPRIEIGATESRRMAIVLDTTTTHEDKQLWCWLGSLPGVVFVDVALVGFEQQDELEATPGKTKATVKGTANNGC